MLSIGFTLVGQSPLLCSRPVITNDQDSEFEQAQRKLYLDDDGRPIIPNLNMVRCFLNAGVHFDLHPAELVHAVGIRQSFILIVSQKGWRVDTRYVRDPKTLTRQSCHRPRFDDWMIRADLELDEDLLSANMARNLIERAGSRVGLGDFRPERGGPFGRFQLTRWDMPDTADSSNSDAPSPVAMEGVTP
jgi:hypothetical protein